MYVLGLQKIRIIIQDENQKPLNNKRKKPKENKKLRFSKKSFQSYNSSIQTNKNKIRNERLKDIKNSELFSFHWQTYL